MEKKDQEEKKYAVSADLKWKESFSDGILPFTGVKPALKEFPAEALKKKDLPEHTEGSIFKSFKGKAAPVFNKGNLVYNTKDDKFYKVLDLKTDDEYKPTWASLVAKDTKDTKEISNSKDFDQYINYVPIYVSINKVGSDTQILEANPRIYDKLEVSLEPAFEGAGLALMGYKLFYNGNHIEKDVTLSSLEGIKAGCTFYASEGFGKPFTFNRFPKVYTNYGWSNSGSYPDGIAFIPNQNIKV